MDSGVTGRGEVKSRWDEAWVLFSFPDLESWVNVLGTHVIRARVTRARVLGYDVLLLDSPENIRKYTKITKTRDYAFTHAARGGSLVLSRGPKSWV